MLPAMRIVVIPGTNRAGSLSFRLAEIIAASHREAGREVDLLDLREMGPEFLDPSSYKQPPEAVLALVRRFLAADGVHFVVPEYNGAYPGILKLFIDMLPYPAALDQRPCAFVGLSAGQFQGLRAVEQLQMVTGYRMAYQYPKRVFIGASYQQFNDGGLVDPQLAQRLKDQCDGFAAFVAQVGGSAAKTLA
jgi:chromate reductase